MPQTSDEDQVADDAALLGSTQLSGKHFTKEGPQSPRPLPCAWTSQRRQRRFACVIYTASTLVVMILLALIPDRTFFHERRQLWGCLCLSVAAALVMFVSVQCSNPGYVERGALTEAHGQGPDKPAKLLGEGACHTRKSEDEGSGAQYEEKQPMMTLQDMGPTGKVMERQPGIKGTHTQTGMGRQCGNGINSGREEGSEEDEMDRREGDGYGRDGVASPSRTSGSDSAWPREDKERRRGQHFISRGWCRWCEMRKPLRAHHCRHCRRCVYSLDHHCHFLATCVGERNHCRFLLYLFAQTLACISGLRVLDTGYMRSAHMLGYFRANLLPLSLTVVVWTLTGVAGLLLLFHCFLAVSSLTSHECLKGPERIPYLRREGAQGRGSRGHDVLDLPFSRGLCENLAAFCCLRDGLWACLLGKTWEPTRWTKVRPGEGGEDSTDVCAYPYRNAYWSCC